MKDKVKNLKLKFKKAKQSFYFVYESVELALSGKQDLSYTAKHHLFQYQVLLVSNKYLLEKYEEEISKLKEESTTEKEYEYICSVLDNLITDHQAKSISIDNILRNHL